MTPVYTKINLPTHYEKEPRRLIHDFSRDYPEVNLAIAHDGNQMEHYLGVGLIHAGFSTIS